MTLEERCAALEATVKRLESSESISLEVARQIIDGRLAAELESRGYISRQEYSRSIDARIDSELRSRCFVSGAENERQIKKLVASQLDDRDFLSAQAAQRVVDNRLSAWIKKTGGLIGVSSLVVLASCLVYVFGFLPKEAASLALENSDELKRDIRELTKEIAVQESILSATSSQVDTMRSTTDAQKKKVADMSETLRLREEQIKTDLIALESRLGQSLNSFENKTASQNEVLSIITQKIQLLDHAVARFEGDEGKTLLNRMTSFANTLTSGDGVQYIASLQREIDLIKNGVIDEIKCRSLLVVGPTEKKPVLVRIGANSTGAGRIATYDAGGNIMVSAGSSTTGMGYYAAFGPKSDVALNEKAPVWISIDSTGAGGVELRSADLSRMCFLGQSEHGGGGVFVHGRQDSGKDAGGGGGLFIDPSGAGLVQLYSSSNEILCAMGSGRQGAGSIELRSPNSPNQAGEVAVSMFATQSGHGNLFLRNGAGDTVFYSGSPNSGDGMVAVFDKDGKKTGSLP